MRTDHTSGTLTRSLIGFGVTLLLIVLSSRAMELRLWGLNWYSYFDWYAWLALAAAVLVVPLVMRGAAADSDKLGPPQSSTHSLSTLYGLLTVLVAGAAFVGFSCETHFLGDGMLLLSRLETGGPPIRPWNPGAYLVQDFIFGMFDTGGQEAARLTFRIISWTAGVVFSLALLIASARLFAGMRERLLFTVGVLSGGYALLFFGYVENYPLFVLCIGLFALSGLLVLRGKLSRFWPVLPMLIGALFHPYAIVMFPGCVYLLGRNTSLADRLNSAPRALQIGVIVALAVGLVIGGYYLYSLSYFLRLALVPLVEDRFTVDGYTLLSLKHLTDWFNLLFVLAPTLPILTMVFFSTARRHWTNRPGVLFLMLMILPSLAISFLVDPKLGMPRDWDVFGFVGVPVTVLFYYLVLDRNGSRNGCRLGILGLTLSLVVLGPRVATQATPDKSIALFDAYAAQDKLKSRSGRFVVREYLKQNRREDEAEERRLEDNRILPQETWDLEGRSCFQRGQLDSAMVLFRQAIRFDPSFYLSYANIGITFAIRGQNDSALAYLEIADGLMPSNPDNYNNIGGVLYAMGDTEGAESKWREAIELDVENFVAMQYLARMFKRENRLREYDSALQAIAEGDQVPLDLLVAAAICFVERSDYDAAARTYRKCLAKGLDTAVVCAKQDSIPQLEVIDCED